MKIIKYLTVFPVIISLNSEANEDNMKPDDEQQLNPPINHVHSTLKMLSILNDSIKKINENIKIKDTPDTKEPAHDNKSAPPGVDKRITISSTKNKPDLSGNNNYFNNFYNNFYNNNYNNNHHNNNNGNNNNNDNNNGNNNREVNKNFMPAECDLEKGQASNV